MNAIDQWFTRMPLVAIIRGVRPEEAVAIGEAIRRAGIGIIEVPMNSPDPLASIERLANAMGKECVIGAGTVLTVSEAESVAHAGGKIAVSPNTDGDVIRRCVELGLTPMPGWGTVSEAFAAYAAGARFLKLFPAGTYGEDHVRAARAVLPSDLKVLAVGGVGADAVGRWLAAGVAGFGIGSEIYKPGMTADEVHARASRVVDAVRESVSA